jgi:23S rRNA pseudouridine1911/1915/1917 synthase
VLRGKSAVTNVVLVEGVAGASASLVRCRLETGRTHQIRVHLLEQANTPILADALYGRPAATPLLRSVGADLGRHALHAAELGFRHPMTAEVLHFQRALPQDMAQALERLRAGN